MSRTCPRCLRLNPDQALYCWSDGAVLDGPPAAPPPPVGATPFPFAFVFLSGRACRSFDELVLACEAEWDEAWELLRDGFLEAFFAGIGRADLAAAARRCAADPDPSAGLDRLLAQLPGDARTPPRLGVRTQEFNLGQIPVGTSRRFELCLANEGMGLLAGRITCEGAAWIAVGEGTAEKVFRCHDEARIPVQVIGERLRAGPPQEGRLFIASGGGPACVVVRVETPVVPFGEGVLVGADSPRTLAEKAKESPAEAAALFDSGAVAAWYRANGWTYPVRGRPASGVAGVQQFFEALGLSDPPRVAIDRYAVELEGAPGDPLDADLTLQALDPRPVYAHAESLADWLTAGDAALDGRTARVPLHVAAVPDRPGERLAAQVQVTANGGQHFIVEVLLTVAGEAPAPEPVQAALPVDVPAAAPASVPSTAPGQWAWVVAGALLLVAVLAGGATALLVMRGPGGTARPAAAPEPPAPVAWEDAPPAPPFTGHAAPVLAAAFAGDGGLLTADDAIRQWDVAGREMRRLQPFKGAFAAAAFSPDCRLAALAVAADHTVHVWNLGEARETQTMAGHACPVTCLAFTPDGRRILSGGADGTVRVWDAATGEPAAVLPGHDGPVGCVAVSADGRRALSGGADGVIILWDLIRVRIVRTLEGHKGAVRTAAFSPDGTLALSAAGDADVRLWDLGKSKELRPLKGLAGAPRVAVFSPDGGRVLAGDGDGGVVLWRTSDGKLLRRYDGHAAGVRCAAFFPDGRRALTGGDDGSLKSWALPSSTSELIQLLASDDPADRLRAAHGLGECGADASAAFGPLLRGLRGGDAEFRKAALASLLHLGAPKRADVGVLESLIRDRTFPEGRDYALDALAALGPDARPAALSLYVLLTDAAAPSAARCKAARALGAIGPDAEVRAFVDLYRAAADADPAVSAAALDALERTCPPAKSDLSELQLRLRDDSPAVRRRVLHALAALGPDARDAAPRLADVLAHDPAPDLRLAGLRALRAAAPFDVPSVAAFAAALGDADPAVPAEAALALAAAGPERGGFAALVRALAHKDAAVRSTAEDALKAARLTPDQVRLAGAAVKTADADTRGRLLAVLEAQGPDAAEAMAGLCLLLREGPAGLRRRVIDLVLQTGPAGKQAGAALAALLKDRDESLRFPAAVALANLRADQAREAVPLLVGSLWVARQDDAGAVARRDRAREALATIGAPAAAALAAALTDDFADGPRRPESEANGWARLTAVMALKEMGAAARAPETLRVLDELRRSDPAPDVRDAALAAIAAIGRPR